MESSTQRSTGAPKRRRQSSFPGTLGRFALFWAVLPVVPTPTAADVVRVVIERREEVLGGRVFGEAGAYEKLVGRVYFAFDPASPANASIVDLALAPLNADGEVEAWADFMVLQPVDPARRRGVAWLEVSNRGGKASLRYFNRAERGASDPTVPGDFGDGLLMRQGLTLIWVGWQWDLPDDPRLLRLHGPIVRNSDGSPIQGWVRSDWTVDEPAGTLGLGHRNHRAYPPVEPDGEQHTLTVREGRDAERTPIPRDQWRFVTSEVSETGGRPDRIELDGGFQAGKIYELVYRATEPRITGLGFAVVRDIMAYSKFDLQSEFPTTHGVAFGVSQTGRFLRHFLYDGMNVDEGGRKVFDGMLIHTAGAGRGSFNHRFGQPSRDAHRYSAFFFPTDLFPFSSMPQEDPVTGRAAGLLDELEPGLRPRIMVTNTGYEYWGRAAALIHTSVDGLTDQPPAPEERLYHLAGGQHFVGPFPPRDGSEIPGSDGYTGNPVDFLLTLRALAVDLVEWVADGTEPPATAVPRVAEGTLIQPAGLAFPALRGVDPPEMAHQAYRADYGPRFEEDGVVDFQPPRLGLEFPSLVPQVDGFGNELGGVRGVELRVPVATYTPWLLRQGMAGGNGEMADFIGGFHPLAVTAPEAAAAGDARPSLERLYGSREAFRYRVEAAVADLLAEGFLLEEDVGPATRRALQLWDWVTEPRR